MDNMYLKSSMDRFIVLDYLKMYACITYLKSSMDRFIGPLSFEGGFALRGFKIQYG